MFRTLAVGLLLTGTVASVAAAQTPAPAPAGPPVIVTQGEFILKRAPDRAWISVATETRDPKAADARRKNAETMTAVQAALKSAGVAADAIRTVSFSLTPDLEWAAGRSTMKGYVVRNEVEVRVDDLDKLGDVLDAANSPKGVALSVTGPRFDLKNQDAAENDALRQAVEAAMTRAQAIATGARRTLGPIVRIEEQRSAVPGQPRPMMMAARAADAPAPTPVTPGDVEVRAEVTLTIEIR